MVAIIVFGKEFLKWKRDGHLTHIFNPSAFALFLTSIVLIATRATPITWAAEISQTFTSPPNLFIEIFLLGLIVQALFSVTLVTLSAAAMLYVLNVVYTGSTGMYHFVDFNIHPAVFLGLHLLVTDPATSPRKNFGKVIFGAAYGAGVFGLFGLLGSLGAPQLYDKLLCVPALNLTVRALDRASIALSARWKWGKFQPFEALSAWTPQQANFGFMGIWAAFFGFMVVTGFLGGKHPGGDLAFWEKACDAGRTEACRVQAHLLDVQCQANSALGCSTLGMLLSGGKGLPRDSIGAARSFTHACGLGFESACNSIVNLVKTDGDGVLLESCGRGYGESCFMLGSLYYGGQSGSRNLEYSATLFEQSCTAGFTRGCGQLGESYLFGEGVPRDMIKAKQFFEKACDGGYAPECFNLGLMHRNGISTPKDEPLAQARFRRGCDLGYQAACEALMPTHSTAK
jgi:Sel1 repeat